ncbi:hypothetical protein M0Q50_02305 [bacterium]|jgi:hypothetical protein|nr:hypothetical protein [bacterium]
MANHGYINTNQELNINDLLLNINTIINNNFNCIKASIEYDNICIYLDFIDRSNCITLWISDEHEYGYYIENVWIEHEKSFLVKEKSVIEIRHGHISILFWWLEYWLTNQLALLYDSYIRDDGYDDVIAPKNISVDFFDYIKTSRYHMNAWKYEKNMNNLSETKTDQEIIDIFINNKKLFDRINKLKTI